MAQYHAHGSISHGACATYAYDLRETIIDPLDNKVKDYRHREDLLHKNSFMPENAPKEWTEHPELCWISVAKREGKIIKETGKKARHARKIEFALPKELTLKEQIRICDKLAQFYAKMGMCVSYGIHTTKNGNVHCHMLLTLRKLEKDGTWAKAKNKSQYVYETEKDENGKDKLDKKGNKIYKLDKNGNKIKIPILDEEGNQKFRLRPGKGKEMLWVREVVSVSGWDYNEFFKKKIREKIQNVCNAVLRIAGRSERVDCRSYEERKINRRVTIHEGYNKEEKEKRHKYNEDVRAYNAKTETWEELQEELLRRLAKEAAEKAAKRGEKYHTIAEPVIDDSQRPDMTEVEEVIDDVREQHNERRDSTAMESKNADGRLPADGRADDDELRAIREYLEKDSVGRSESIASEGRDYNSEGRADSGFDWTKYEIEARLDANARTLGEAGRSAGTVEQVGADTRELEQRIRDLLAAERKERTVGKGHSSSESKSKHGRGGR